MTIDQATVNHLVRDALTSSAQSYRSQASHIAKTERICQESEEIESAAIILEGLSRDYEGHTFSLSTRVYLNMK